MRPALLLALVLSAASLSAMPLSCSDHAIIMILADAYGVPRSVADRLQIEESGDPVTGTWGDSEAVSKVPGPTGYHSFGLYQIYYEPVNLAYLLAHYYPHPPQYFDWRDPIDSAVVGLGYLADLHRRYGTWELAARHYTGAVDSADTRAYARRIIDWPGMRE